MAAAGRQFEKQSRAEAMQTRKSPIDRRPFQSKAEREREQSLEQKYLTVAIPELVAALAQPKRTGSEQEQAA
jgi:hypothetical protein